MKLSFVINIFIALNLLPLLGLAGQWFMFRMARVPLTAIKVFYGPTLITWSFQGTPLSIGCLPLGACISYNVPCFIRRPLPMRLAIILSGPAFLFLIAIALLGFSSSVHHFLAGPGQLLSGTLHPATTARNHIAHLFTAYSTNFLTFAGIIAAKFTTYSLLPFGGVATVQCVLQFFDPACERKAANTYFMLSALTGMAIAISWIFALVLYALAVNG